MSEEADVSPPMETEVRPHCPILDLFEQCTGLICPFEACLQTMTCCWQTMLVPLEISIVTRVAFGFVTIAALVSVFNKAIGVIITLATYCNTWIGVFS